MVEIRDELERLEADVRSLTDADIAQLVVSYRGWAPVMASALDTIPSASLRAMRPLTGRVREIVASRLGADASMVALERVTMAVWLYLVSRVAGDGREMAAILEGPWSEVGQRDRPATSLPA